MPDPKYFSALLRLHYGFKLQTGSVIVYVRVDFHHENTPQADTFSHMRG